MTSRILLPKLLACFVLVACSCSLSRAATWTTNDLLHVGRYNHTATLLTDGKVLIAGGVGYYGVTNSVEIFNPITGSNSTANPLGVARTGHTSTMLMNGKVLLVGGTNKSGILASTELFDPITRTWCPSGDLNTARFAHTASLLADGRVLVSGGCATNNSLSSSELFDPTTGIWTATSNEMNVARGYHTATLLTNGTVYVCGGQGNSAYLASAEVFDPITQTWNAVNDLITGRRSHTASLLPNGTVLIAGGTSATGTTNAEIYDSVAGNSFITGSLKRGRSGHTATLLPNGTVLFIGGDAGSTAEFFNPQYGTNALASLPLFAIGNGHSATLLADGRVLVVQSFGLGYNFLNSLTLLYDYSNPSWSPIPSAPVTIRTMTLLPDGTVLATGGTTNLSSHTNEIYAGLTTAQIYDPKTGGWILTNSMHFPRTHHTVTLLPNGKVLVAGGYSFVNDSIPGSVIEPLASELFDPPSGEWTISGNLNNARDGHVAVLLPTGKVLVAGGYCATNSQLLTCELYDPTTGIWTLTGSLHAWRLSATATLLPNGKVLLAGGYSGSGPTSSTELYDPSTGIWTTITPMNSARDNHTACLLPNGRVLIAGGRDASSAYLSSAETYDYLSNTWNTVGPMADTRASAVSVLLSTGRILLAGGKYQNIGQTLNRTTTELFDPVLGTWTNGPALSTGHSGNPMVLLPNGKALIAGATNGVTAALFDVGLGYANVAQPQITSIDPISIGSPFSITGAQFRGVAESSSGNTRDSSTDYPLVQMRSFVNGQIAYIPMTGWTTNSLNTACVAGFPPGYAMVTLIVNGIPSTSTVTNVSAPSGPPVLTGTKLSSSSFQIDFFAAPALTFSIVRSSTITQNRSFIGTAVEIAPGQYRYVDSGYPKFSPQLFYSAHTY